MKKYFLISIVFILSLFIFNINFFKATASGVPDCSTISGYQLTQGQSCSTTVNTSTVFNFSAKDPSDNNMSWSINWGDGQGFPSTCPSSLPNTNLSVSHAWSQAGTYNVNMSVTNCKGGTAPASFNIVVIDSSVTGVSNIIAEKPIPTVLSSDGYDFDATIQKIGTWPTIATQGTSITFNAKIFNLGTQEDPKFSYLYFGYTTDPSKPGHGSVCLYRTDSNGIHEVSCPAMVYLGSSFNVQDTPVCGNNNYVLKVDAYNDVPETNENNNEVSGNVYVDCSKKPDFVINEVGSWPTVVQNGTKPVFNFVEKNIGEGGATAGVVRMMVNGIYRAGSWPGQYLSPGSQTSSIQFGYQQFSSPPTDDDWWIPVCKTGDKFTLTMCADNACGWGTSEIDESNENNNILNYQVTCQ